MNKIVWVIAYATSNGPMYLMENDGGLISSPEKALHFDNIIDLLDEAKRQELIRSDFSCVEVEISYKTLRIV